MELREARARARPARRAVQPARVDRGRRARVGAVAARLVEDDVVAAGDPLVLRVHGAVGGVDRGDHGEAGLDELVRARGLDLQPDAAAGEIA